MSWKRCCRCGLVLALFVCPAGVAALTMQVFEQDGSTAYTGREIEEGTTLQIKVVSDSGLSPIESQTVGVFVLNDDVQEGLLKNAQQTADAGSLGRIISYQSQAYQGYDLSATATIGESTSAGVWFIVEYECLGWETDGQVEIDLYDYAQGQVTQTVVVNQAFDGPDNFTLTTQVTEGEGTISPAGETTHAHHSSVQLTATPAEGYRVKSWSGAANVPATGSTTNEVFLDENKTVQVAFEEIPPVMVTLTTSVSEGMGSIDPNGQTVVQEGTIVNLTATPAEGYQLKAWSGTDDDSRVETTNTVTVDTNTVVTVAFEEISIIERQIGGRVFTNLTDPDGSGLANVRLLIDDGETVRFAFTDDAGVWTKTVVEGSYTVRAASENYRFHFMIDGDPNEGQDSVQINVNEANETANQNLDFWAVSTLVQYVLTTEVIDGEGGTIMPAGGGVYDKGEVVQVTAVPDENYELLAWFGTDDDTSTALTNTVTMNTDRYVGVLFLFNPTAELEIEQCTVIPGLTAGFGTFIVRGEMPTSPELSEFDTVGVTFGPYEKTGISMQTVGNNHIHRSNIVLILNPEQDDFIMVGQHVDLRGLQNPVHILIEYGNFVGSKDHEVENLSLRFLRGRQDKLQIDSVRTVGSLLLVSGGIAAEDVSHDLRELEVTIRAYEQSYVLPVGSFRKTGTPFQYVNPAANAGQVYLASIDFDLTRFTLMLRGGQAKDSLQIRFSGYDVQDDFPE